MHDVYVRDHKGRKYQGHIIEFRPEKGFMEIWDDLTEKAVKLFFRELSSAIEKTQRVSVNKICDVDLIKRAKEEGWKDRFINLAGGNLNE